VLRVHAEHLSNGEWVRQIELVAVLFVFSVSVIVSYGHPVARARTIALNTPVVMEIVQLFFIRNIYGTSLAGKAGRGTKVVWFTVVLITVA